MALIGYHASHEQFPPGELLSLVQQAERAGFAAAMCSDHFHPWSEAQGQSGHAWTWLGAAMATTRLPFGAVTSPVGRCHPAIAAQAVATLHDMYGERFTLAVGSGEALNEAITGEPWPPKYYRNERLREAVEILRALWRGEEVTHHGAVVIEQARLYTRPATTPPVFIAALTEKTARWAGTWADGLITISMPHEQLRALLLAFRRNGGEGKPVHLQVRLSYADTEERALTEAHAQWRTNLFPGSLSEELRTPRDFEAAATHVTGDDIREAVHVSSDPQRHAQWLQDYIAMGFERLYLHNVNRDQQRFIEVFGERVLSQLQPR